MKRCQKYISKRKCKRLTSEKHCWQHKMYHQSYLSSLPKDLIYELGLFLPYNDMKSLISDDAFLQKYYKVNYCPVDLPDMEPIKTILDEWADIYDKDSGPWSKFITAVQHRWTIKMEQLLPNVIQSDIDWYAYMYGFGIMPKCEHMTDFFISKIPQCKEYIPTGIQFAILIHDLTALNFLKKYISDSNIYTDTLKWLGHDVLTRGEHIIEAAKWLIDAGADVNVLTIAERSSLQL